MAKSYFFEKIVVLVKIAEVFFGYVAEPVSGWPIT